MNIYADIPLIRQVSTVLADMLGEDFDEATFWDSLDGETDVLDIADRVIARMQEDAALADAAAAQAAALASRAARLTARGTAHKAALLHLLDAAGQKKLERPAATISRRAGSVSVNITNEDDIPSQLMTVKTTTAPDKAAIKRAIEDGETIPGAELVRGPDSLIVKVK